jgi:DNA-directed RNA polymerase subunit RPC12/RpoP
MRGRQHSRMSGSMSGLGYRRKPESHAESRRLVCRACGYERIPTAAWIDQLRARAPGTDCGNTELLARLLHQFRCSNCQAKNVDLVQEIQEKPDRGPANDGDLSPLCAQCGEVIPIKRLRAVPGTPFCVRCQEGHEHGPPEEEPVNCKQCGAKMVWRIRT